MFAFDFGLWGPVSGGGSASAVAGPGATNSCAAFGQGIDFAAAPGLPISNASPEKRQLL